MKVGRPSHPIGFGVVQWVYHGTLPREPLSCLPTSPSSSGCVVHSALIPAPLSGISTSVHLQVTVTLATAVDFPSSHTTTTTTRSQITGTGTGADTCRAVSSRQPWHGQPVFAIAANSLSIQQFGRRPTPQSWHENPLWFVHSWYGRADITSSRVWNTSRPWPCKSARQPSHARPRQKNWQNVAAAANMQPAANVETFVAREAASALAYCILHLSLSPCPMSAHLCHGLDIYGPNLIERRSSLRLTAMPYDAFPASPRLRSTRDRRR